MATYRDLTALPEHLRGRNALPVYFIASKGVGKSCAHCALAEFLDNHGAALGVSYHTWSASLRRQRDRILLEHGGLEETPPLSELAEPEWSSFVYAGRLIVPIGVPGEDVLQAGAKDPVAVRRLIADGIALFCHNPALEAEHRAGGLWMAKGCHRAHALFLHSEHGYPAAVAFERAAAAVWGSDGFDDLHCGWDRVRGLLANAKIALHLNEARAERRWKLEGLSPDDEDRANLALHMIARTVTRHTSLQDNCFAQVLPLHPCVVRKVTHLDVLAPQFLPGLSLNPDEQLRRLFGGAAHHLTAGGPDVESRVMGEGDRAVEIDDFSTDGPEQLWGCLSHILNQVPARGWIAGVRDWLHRPAKCPTAPQRAAAKAPAAAPAVNRIKAAPPANGRKVEANRP